jgi:hypothetical protein
LGPSRVVMFVPSFHRSLLPQFGGGVTLGIGGKIGRLRRRENCRGD